MAAVRTAVSELEAEHKLLAQLLYRNHNQHSSTDLFSTLKSVNRNLKLLLPDKLLVVISKLDASVKGAGQAKLSASDLADLFSGNIMTTAAVDLVSLCVEQCITGAVCVRRLLGKKVFLPLYSTLLALSARLLRCLTEIHDFLHAQGSALALQLKHTELTQPRLAKTISEHLSAPQSRFTERTVVVHNRLRPQADSLAAPGDSISTTSIALMSTANAEKTTGKRKDPSKRGHSGAPVTELSAGRGLSGARNLSSNSLDSSSSARYDSGADEDNYGDVEDAGDALVSVQGAGADTGGIDSTGLDFAVSSAASKSSPNGAVTTPAIVSVPIAAPVLLPVETDYDALFGAPPGGVFGGDVASEKKQLKKRKLESTDELEGQKDSQEKMGSAKKASSVIKLKKSSSNGKLAAGAPTKGNKVDGDLVKVKKGKKKDGNSGDGGKRSKEDDIDDIFGF